LKEIIFHRQEKLFHIIFDSIIMVPKSCLYQIEQKKPQLSEKELLIANFILEEPARAVNPSLDELSKAIGISDTTLFRFVKKLGYTGYQQFRIALATEALDPKLGVYDTTELVTDSQSAVHAVFERNSKALEQTLQLLDLSAFDQAARLMSQANSLILFGLGGSSTVAQDGYHKFIRTGLPVFAPVDFHMQIMIASQMSDTSVGLLISHSGFNKDSLYLAESIKQSGASLIILTSQSNSPLVSIADKVLLCAGQKSSYASEAFAARIAQLSVLDALYLEVMNLVGEPGIKSIQSMRNAIAGRKL
jgi:RpiR family carbohydrate utilization transcriptional regulator